MKLKTIKPLLYLQKTNKKAGILLYLIFTLFSFTEISAQKLNFNFNNISLSEALVEVSSQLKINIAFDAQKLNKIIVNKSIHASSNAEVIKALIDNTGFQYTEKHNSYLIVPVKKEISEKKINPNKYRLSGSISDSESGEMLPYATIFVLENNLHFFSSPTGTFSFKYMDNSLKLKVSCMGFNTLDTTLYLRNTVSNCILKMNKKLVQLPIVNITGEKLRIIEMGKDAGHISFNPANFTNLPNGSQPDVFATLQLLPGIASNENSSALSIRGSENDENLVLLDGFTLYNLDHFFGQFSTINPNYIKDIQIYKGGFDSRYGERVSAIIDITGKSGSQNNVKANGGINLISSNLGIEIPLGKKTTWIATGRKTYYNLFNSPLFKDIFKNRFFADAKRNPPKNAVELTPNYYFYDVNTKISHQINDKEKITFSAFASKDFLDLSNSSQNLLDTIETQNVNKWENYGISSSWSKQWNNGLYSLLTVGYSGYSNTFFDSTKVTHYVPIINPNPNLPNRVNNFQTNEGNELTDLFLALKSSYLFNNNHRIDFGFLTRKNEFSFEKKSDGQYLYNNLKNSAVLSSIFVQDQYTIFRGLTIKPGFRLNHYELTRKLYFEPRLSASYQINETIGLKMAAGKYFQFLNKVSTDQQYGYNRDFWILSDESRHPIIESDHFILGTNLTFGNFLFDVEAYYKTTHGIQEYFAISNYQRGTIPDFNNPLQVTNKFVVGNGSAMGLDAMLKFESRLYTGWISYTRSKSYYHFQAINKNEEIPALFDQPHKFTFVNLISWRKWNFSALYIFASGQPYISKQDQDTQFNIQRTYSRLPNYNRIDISANYNLSIKKLNIKLGATIINLLNFRNYYSIYTRKFDFQNNSFTQTSIIKAQGLTPNVFLEFNF